MSKSVVFLFVVLLGTSACWSSAALQDASSSISARAGDDKNFPPELSPETALTVLEAYFSALNAGSYMEAARIFGGDCTPLLEFNPDIPQDDQAALFASACRTNGYLCDLQLGEILRSNRLSDLAVQFTVTLTEPDGSPFELGPCCGVDQISESPLREFVYTVAWQDGLFQVLELPVYSP